jgi:hypothetical protein
MIHLETTMTLAKLPPNQLVELTDVLTRGKKLAFTDETGQGYFDLLGDDEVPAVLLVELEPTPLGTINSWLEQLSGADSDAFLESWGVLTERNLDVLTIARALRWGMQNKSFDPTILESVGVAETARVRDARQAAKRALMAR